MNAVYIHIPKTAGSHLKRALGLHNMSLPRQRKEFQQKGIVTFGHQDYLRLIKIGVVSKEFDDSALKFTFCRNPFDRAVSHYFYVKKAHPELIPDETFLEFTRLLNVVPVAEKHKRRQTGWVWFRKQVCSIRNIPLDFIGRYEQLEKDKQRIAGMIGSYVRPAKRLRQTKHKPYWMYYSDEAIENVRTYYKEDFEYFGYNHNILHP